MSKFTELNGFYYDEELLKLSKTAEYHQRERDRLTAIRKAMTPDEVKNMKGLGPGYSAWMHGRRLSDTRSWLFSQDVNKHYVARVYVGGFGMVCVCGLATGIDDSEDPSKFLDAPGHIDRPTREIVTLFATKIPDVGEEVECYCQVCRKSFTAPLAAEPRFWSLSNADAKQVIAAALQTHKCTRDKN